MVPASLWAPWHGVGLSGLLPSSRLRPHNEQHSRNQSACQGLEIADDIAVLQRDGTRRRYRDPRERRFTVGVGSHVVVETEKSQDLSSEVWAPRRGPGSGGPGALVSPSVRGLEKADIPAQAKGTFARCPFVLSRPLTDGRRLLPWGGRCSLSSHAALLWKHPHSHTKK